MQGKNIGLRRIRSSYIRKYGKMPLIPLADPNAKSCSSCSANGLTNFKYIDLKSNVDTYVVFFPAIRQKIFVWHWSISEFVNL